MRGPRQPRQAHLFGVTLVTVVLLAFAAAPASAVHSHAATYTGTFAAGGSIAFDVSADGDSITRLKVTDVPTECGTLTAAFGYVPVQNDSFSQTTPPLGSSGGDGANANGGDGANATGGTATGGTTIGGTGGTGGIGGAGGTGGAGGAGGAGFSGAFLRFSGTFTAPQKAHGTLQYAQVYPPCASSQLSWSATTPTVPPPGPDQIPPVVVLSGKTTQKTGAAVSVTVSCINEACRTTATGAVSVPGSGRYTLTSAVARIGKGARAQLELKLPVEARRAIKKAQRKRKAIKASITVTARDAAGNETVKTRTIRLT